MVGRYYFSKTHWIAEIPEIEVISQGSTSKEAMDMLGDAIEVLINDDRLKMTVVDCGDGELSATSSFPLKFDEFVKQRKRGSHETNQAS